ncbi:GtrA family protein [Phenylobacterium montanum]|uniref:GtrA family protein n=1 Tax=Phenylobacterium montanum TaxID=2823693 RepID=A0A975G0V2_9CAUL|nr:GtrA family protein [Caulobacter sp. S6]QUD88478.1 GtrA family protein [Caulobacter sp. S6]
MTSLFIPREPHLARLARFGLIGAVSTLIYAGLSWTLTTYGHAEAVKASLIAYTVSGIFSYLAQRRFTFRSSTGHSRAAPRFIVVTVLGVVIATLAPLLLTDRLHQSPLLAIAITCGLVPLANYLALDRLVFRPAPEAAGIDAAGLWRLATIAMFGLGAIMSAMRRTDVDVAWLLTLGEKMLDGQRAYVDFFEANPPMSILLYLPAVVLGRATPIPAEAWVNILTLTAIAASLVLCGRILAKAVPDRARLWALAATAAFVLTVLPTGVFTQREHIAVVAMLPFLVLTLARSEGETPSWLVAALAGLGCGVAMAIKPHFALAAGPPALIAALRRRSLKPIFATEIWAASAVVFAYAFLLLTAFKPFLAFMPAIREAYLPARRPLVQLLICPPIPIFLLLVLLTIDAGRRHLRSAWIPVGLMAAAAGGLASCLIQGKGWPYQAYPMLAFAALALAAAVVLGWRDAAASRLPPLVRISLIGSCAALSMGWSNVKGDYHQLNAPVAALVPHPRLLSISADIALGHPLTRELHGHWVGSVCSQWMTAGVLAQARAGHLSLARRTRLRQFVGLDRRILVNDILRGRPDIILVSVGGFDWGAWARADPALAAALAPYRPVRTVDGVAIWARS